MLYEAWLTDKTEMALLCKHTPELRCCALRDRSGYPNGVVQQCVHSPFFLTYSLTFSAMMWSLRPRSFDTHDHAAGFASGVPCRAAQAL